MAALSRGKKALLSSAEIHSSKHDRNGPRTVCVRKLQHIRGKRLHEKKLACLFCGNLYKHRISEHLAKVHSSELEVAKAMAKDGDARKQLLDILKHKGNYKHNIRVLSAPGAEEGELIVARRSDAVHTSNDYLPCIYCLGFFRTRELWRHCRTCGGVSRSDSESTVAVIAKSRMLLNGSMPCELTGDDVTLDPLVSSMKRDAVFHSVMNDSLLKKFGVVLLEKLGIRRKHDITQRMRQLGRLKLEISPNDFQLMDKISAKHFDVVIQNVFKLSVRKENAERITVFEKPGLALRLGHNLVKCAQLKRGLCLRSDDEIGYKDANRFLELHASEWCDKVSSIALATLKTNKFNKPALLPITSDLVVLKNYMDLRIAVITAHLKNEPEIHAWRELAEVTLTKVIVFNKRRSAEAALLLRSTYDNRGDWKRSANKEIYDSLTNIEKRLFARLDVVQTQGKQNKTVSTLLTKQMVIAIDLLNRTRKQCGMDDRNPYVFSSKGDGPLATWQILRKVATFAGCKHPELISSTRLRKYMATVAQVIDLDSSELHWLSSHLGHDVSTHKEFYRRHEATLEVTKISRLLMAAEAGQLGRYSGKKLKDINPEEINIPGEESADEDDEPDVSADNPDTDSIDTALCGSEVRDDVCPEQRNTQSKKKPKRTIGSEVRDDVCPEQRNTQSKKKPKRTIDSDTDSDLEPEAYMPRKRRILEDGSIVDCKVSRKQWSEEENVEFLKVFNTYIDRRTMPPGSIIRRVSETSLNNRTIAQIRTRVHNFINKKQKQIN